MKEQHISWGRVIVGAAVVAGAIAAFVWAAPSLVPAVQTAATAVGEAVSAVWSWLGANVVGQIPDAAHEGTGLLGFMIKNQALSIGAAALAGGVIAARPREQKTFATSEDLRRIEALLQARMGQQGQGLA